MSELVLRNRQRVRALDLRQLRRIARALLEDVLELHSYELGVHLVAVPEMTRLNETFLEHAGSTDVITFDHSGPSAAPGPPQEAGSALEPALHGEIFICLQEAVDQARRFGTTWPSEVVRYLIHGVLHARGHDDLNAACRRRMKREEDRLLRELAGRFRLSELAREPRVRS